MKQLEFDRDQLKVELECRMQNKMKCDRRIKRLADIESAGRQLREKSKNLKAKLRKIETRFEEMRQTNAGRMDELSLSVRRLSEAMAGSNTDHQHRYETTLLTACENESREKIKTGMLQLTKAIEMKRTTTGIEMMGVSLPKMIHPMPDMPDDTKRHLGALLGYVYMMVERLGFAIDAPLLHVGRFEGSTSHVIKPDRIFDRRKNARWVKHRLFLSAEDLDHDGNWMELVAGVYLIKRSLRCLAASLSISIVDTRISLFDLLLVVITHLTSNLTVASQTEAVRDVLIDDNVSEGSAEDEWCEVDAMILPPPPSAETDIAHYETAMNMHTSHTHLGLTDSIRNLFPKFPTTVRWMYKTALRRNFPSEEK